MTKSKAIQITIANRKPQKQCMLDKDFYFRPQKKIKLNIIYSMIKDYHLLCDSQLMCNYYAGKFEKFYK